MSSSALPCLEASQVTTWEPFMFWTVDYGHLFVSDADQPLFNVP